MRGGSSMISFYNIPASLTSGASWKRATRQKKSLYFAASRLRILGHDGTVKFYLSSNRFTR